MQLITSGFAGIASKENAVRSTIFIYVTRYLFKVKRTEIE